MFLGSLVVSGVRRQDGDDPATRVPLGPQLKIKNQCKKKMKELGFDTGPEAADDKPSAGKSGGGGGGKKGYTGPRDKCLVCRAQEIEVRTHGSLVTPHNLT